MRTGSTDLRVAPTELRDESAGVRDRWVGGCKRGARAPQTEATPTAVATLGNCGWTLRRLQVSYRRPHYLATPDPRGNDKSSTEPATCRVSGQRGAQTPPFDSKTSDGGRNPLPAHRLPEPRPSAGKHLLSAAGSPPPAPAPRSQLSPRPQVHEQEERQVHQHEQPEVQPVRVLGQPVRRGLRPRLVVLLRPRRVASAPPPPGPVRAASRRRRAPLHRAPAAPQPRQPQTWQAVLFRLRAAGKRPGGTAYACAAAGPAPRRAGPASGPRSP